MSFQSRFSFYVFILSVVLLVCSFPSVNAVKRTLETSASSPDTTVACTQISPIQNLVPDVLRRIFAMGNRTAIIQVCKWWFELANFKQNWPGFCDTYATVLLLSARDYQRIYYLMLKADDVAGMAKLIVTDNDKKNNFKALSKIVYKHPGELAQSQHMKDLLEAHEVLQIRKLSQDLDRSTNQYTVMKEQRRALPESEWPVTRYRNDKLGEKENQLADILLRNDMQTLNADENNNTVGSQAQKIVAEYGSLAAIGKFLKVWNKEEAYELLEWICAQKCPRLNSVEFLLSQGVCPDGKTKGGTPLVNALYNRDYLLLELLCKHGVDLSDPYECLLAHKNANQLMQDIFADNGDDQEVSSLMYAVSIQDPRLVHILFKYGGVDPYEIDDRHEDLGDVLDFAKRLGNQEIVGAIVLARIVEDNVKSRALKQEQTDTNRVEHDKSGCEDDVIRLVDSWIMPDAHEYNG